MYTFGSQRLLPVKTKYYVLPIILHASKADILAMSNVTCIKSEIKKFDTYLYDLVLPMVNYSWLVHNINTVQ